MTVADTENYVFDTPSECVERALRGFERRASLGVVSSDTEILNALQVQFPTFTRTELTEIMTNFDDVGDFNI